MYDSAHTITIYKAPQKDKGQRLLNDGFQPADFSYSSPNAVGEIQKKSLVLSLDERLWRYFTSLVRVLAVNGSTIAYF